MHSAACLESLSARLLVLSTCRLLAERAVFLSVLDPAGVGDLSVWRICLQGSSTEMEQVIHMNAGLGEFSYAQNSTISQKTAIEVVQPMLEESILSMDTVECNTFCIAELGCSSGPNALSAIENVIKFLQAKYFSAGNPVPQFQVLFNDLPTTDFNSLFRSLPPLVMSDKNGGPGRSYFTAGVPGSFFGRLFPDKSLHFVHSSYSLHWLSQIPSEVLEKDSATWNKGKIYAGGSPAVGEAYLRQYLKDFNGFLRARAQELVRGGRMFLVLMGRTSREPSDQGFSARGWEWLGSSLNDLGLIEEEMVDSFNLPLFIPCPEEVSSEVAREGSFEIQRLEILRKPDTGEKLKAMRGSASEREAYGKRIAKEVRAVTESLLEYHFGEKVIDVLFQRYGETFAKRWNEPTKYPENGEDLVIVVERK